MFPKRNRVTALVMAIAFFTAVQRLFGAEPAPAMPEQKGVISDFPDWVTSIAFAPDGSTLACGTYDEVRVVDPGTKEVTKTLKTRNGYVRDLAFTPDGSRLIVADYQAVSLWNLDNSRRLKKFSGHRGYVTGLALAGERLFSSSEDGTIRVWNLDSGEAVRTIEPGVPVNDIALSPDGKLLATAGGDATRPTQPGPVSLWNAETGEKLHDFIGHERTALAVRFSADGNVLASAGEDEKVNLYDVPGRKAIGFYAEHARSVNDIVFLADAAVLASVSGGNAGGKCEIHLWKTDGTTLSLLEPHEQRLTAIAVSPDEKMIAVASQDKSVSLWNPRAVIGGAANEKTTREPVEAARK